MDDNKIEWFNNIDIKDQHYLINIIYDIVHSGLGTKLKEKYEDEIEKLELYYENIINNRSKENNDLKLHYENHINTITTEKNNLQNILENNYQDQLESFKSKYQYEIRELKSENKFLRDENFRNIKDSIIQVQKDIATNFTPIKLGRVGEKKVFDLLTTKYPKCETIDSSSRKGDGDIIFCCNNIRFLIECKNQNDAILRSDPNKIFDRFKADCIDSIENNRTDIGIFIAQNVVSIPNYGTFEAQEIVTSRGKTYLIYISDIFNVPERLDAAIELGIQLYLNTDHDNDNMANFMKLNDKINSLNDNLSNLLKLNKNQLDIIKQMANQVNDTRLEIDESIQDINMFQEIINIIKDMMHNNGYKNISIRDLENELRKHKIPPRKIRDNGGIKNLKKVARDQIKNEKQKKIINNGILNL